MNHWKIIKKKLKGTLNKQEHKLFNNWLESEKSHQELFEKVSSAWTVSQSNEYDSTRAFKQLKKRIGNSEFTAQQTIIWKSKWVVAASISIALLVGILFLSQKPGNPPALLSKKTLTSQRSTVTLTDGSVVYLNSNSEIIYPQSFEETDERVVELKGEGFFDVRPNPNKPFRVITGGVNTTVLGTSFNIMARKLEEVEVTVKEGKVAVSSNRLGTTKKGTEVTLTAGQQVIAELHSEDWQVREVITAEFQAWRGRELHLDQVSFATAIEKIERIYGVPIINRHQSKTNCLIRGTYRNENLKTVLDGLKLIANFNYEVASDTIYITHYRCD